MNKADILYLYETDMITASEAVDMLHGRENTTVKAYLSGKISELEAWNELKECQNLAQLIRRK